MSTANRWGDERGSATVTGAYVIAGITVLVLLVLYVAAAVVARHRAQSAADLSALAAAAQQVVGAEDPCVAARQIAAAQEVSARVVGCSVRGEDMMVGVEVPVSLGPFGIRTATARARAGPVG